MKLFGFFEAIAAAMVLALPFDAALAQNYPFKPITVIVPFAPGGGSDNVARMITAKLTENTGKAFIIDNRPGGGTNMGNEAAARATPDGYTVLLGQFTLTVNNFLFAGLRYNALTSFVPVAHIADAPTVLVVPAQSPITDIPGLIAAARAQPGKLNFGSGGSGTSVHLAGVLFGTTTGTSLVHIPYKGSAPAMTDLMGGQIDMMFDTSTSALPQIKGGRVRALGIAGPNRLSALPEVPTFTEQGLKAFSVPAWYGIVAPTGTPAAAIRWLNMQVDAALKDPAIISRLDMIGAVAVGGTPEQMGAFMKDQSSKWSKVIKDGNIKLE